MTAYSLLAEKIDAVLPQTQCRQCGYDGCAPYAAAVAAGIASINRCPPGGDDTIRELAELTGRPYAPLDPALGAIAPPAVAVIDEATCIGCALCIQACPVDAILGAAKRMHTVIASECTGCGLCLPPCPVDCIAMVETGATPPVEERRQRAAQYRRRYRARLERERIARAEAAARKAAVHRKRSAVERAMQRARERLSKRMRG